MSQGSWHLALGKFFIIAAVVGCGRTALVSKATHADGSWNDAASLAGAVAGASGRAGAAAGSTIASKATLHDASWTDTAAAAGAMAGSSSQAGAEGGTAAAGVSGTGGDTSTDCSHGCPADSECVDGTCEVRWGGMACTSSDDCPSWATCCDGSDESCDGTRVPVGDGAAAGQLVVDSEGLTVADTVTGLVWQRDGTGLRSGCTGPGSRTCTWDEAKAYCATLVLGGLSGWRLPGERELVTIADFTRANPSIDTAAFPGLEGLSLTDKSWEPSLPFWTSSTSKACSSSGDRGRRYVDFSVGDWDCPRSSDKYLVRCVRGSRCYPKHRFVPLAGGLVRDTLTRLVWQQELSGSTFMWPKANDYCSSSGGGFRLPTLKEASSIVDLTFPKSPGPAIDQTAFPYASSSNEIWTASPYAAISGTEWYLTFNNGVPHQCGNTDQVGYLLKALCVR